LPLLQDMPLLLLLQDIDMLLPQSKPSKKAFVDFWECALQVLSSKKSPHINSQ